MLPPRAPQAPQVALQPHLPLSAVPNYVSPSLLIASPPPPIASNIITGQNYPLLYSNDYQVDYHIRI